MRRGEVYDARLYPSQGSEQSGIRPVIIVSRDAINTTSTVVIAVPCTTYQPSHRVYPSETIIRAPDGGLKNDSVALGAQVRSLSISRFLRLRGLLSASALARVDQTLLVAMDLPGQI